MAAVMAATAVVAVASPAQAYVDCQENLGSTYYSIRCRSATYGASYNAYVYCTNGGRYEGPYYFLSGNPNYWGPWSTASCPGGQYVESYGKETYG
jgi:hypothetical protein